MIKKLQVTCIVMFSLNEGNIGQINTAKINGKIALKQGFSINISSKETNTNDKSHNKKLFNIRKLKHVTHLKTIKFHTHQQY